MPRKSVLVTLLGLGVVGVMLAAPTAALAATAAPSTASPSVVGQVFVNGTVAAQLGLNVRSDSPTGAVVDTMPYNSTALLSCWVSGPSVTGPWGATSVWDAVESYTTPSGSNVALSDPGHYALASDAWLNTGGDTSKMLPHC